MPRSSLTLPDLGFLDKYTTQKEGVGGTSTKTCINNLENDDIENDGNIKNLVYMRMCI